jgi:hypothetical protein
MGFDLIAPSAQHQQSSDTLRLLPTISLMRKLLSCTFKYSKSFGKMQAGFWKNFSSEITITYCRKKGYGVLSWLI